MASHQMSGKTAFITGGASGIGAATARIFADRGAKVVIADQNTAKAEQLAREIGDQDCVVELDVRHENAWKTATEQARERMGQMTTIVNSAGVSIPINLEKMTLADFHQTTQINLDGVFLGCKFGVELLKSGTGGAIVNVASTMAARGSPMFPAYCASKAGVLGLTRSVALHCAEQNYDIRVNSVLPGAIHTEMVEGYIQRGLDSGVAREDVISGFADQHPMKRLGRPEEVAKAILFLASDESTFSTGSEIAVDGGFLA